MKGQIAAAACLLALAVLGGCTAEEAPESTQAETEEEEVTLHYYIWGDEESYSRKVVEAYNALQGREMVVLHVIPNAEHEQWLKEYDGTVGADLLGLRGNSNVLELQEKGYLTDLNDYIRSSGLDVTAYGNMFNEIMIDGSCYAMPTRSTCWALYYNKEIFDREGVAYPELMTWEEYLELAVLLTSGTGEDKVWGGYYPPWIFNMSAVQQGYYLLDDDMEPTKDALELVGRLYDSGSHMPYLDIRDRGDDCRYDFETGNIAMMINGEWMVNMFLADEEAGMDVPEWDIAPLPVPEGMEGTRSIGQYQFAGIASSCEHPAQAFEFLEFLCGEQGAKIYARDAIIPAYLNEEIRLLYEDAAGHREAGVFFEGEKNQEQLMWDGYSALFDAYDEVAEQYLEKEISLDEAITAFEEERRRLLQ